MNTLAISTDAAVRVVEMNRPDSLNALNPQMMDARAETFLSTASDDEIKVLKICFNMFDFKDQGFLSGNFTIL